MIIVATLLIISAIVYIIARALTKYYTENYTDNYPELNGSQGSYDTSSQTEISDEEIEKAGNYFYPLLGEQSKKSLWINGCKWYREQLKSRQ